MSGFPEQTVSETEALSYNQQAYNNWQYGDEASLYSIAEDSREDRASEVPSMAGTEAASSVLHGVAVEMKWAEETNETRGIRQDGEEPEEHYYGYQHNSRRKYVVMGFACGIFAVGVLSLMMVSLKSDPEQQQRAPEGQATVEAEPQPAPIPAPLPPLPSPVEPLPLATGAPSLRATSSPTSLPPSLSPTHSTAFKLSEALVDQALRKCAGQQYFLDSATPQSQVFTQLTAEVFENTSEEDNYLHFPLMYGMDFLRERYALEMLYAATNGDMWSVNTAWNQGGDPCATGWHGVRECKDRQDGQCAITGLDLSFNDLSGRIPEELCCMPCLQSLKLAGNSRLNTELPACLSGVSVDFTLNGLGTNPSVETAKLP